MTSLGAARRAVGGRGARWLCPSGLAAAFLGCGGAAPLLHPAQALPPDTVSFGAGVSGQFASTGVEEAIDRGRAAAAGPLTDPGTAQAYATGVLMNALIAPGISPWVSARVGLPSSTEAGLTYTGRSLRLDGRYVLPWGSEWALSLGLGASALLLNRDSTTLDGASPGEPSGQQAEFGLDASGWGADVPILVGYQPLDGFVDVWMGARTGFEHVSGELKSQAEDAAAPTFDADGNRIWAGLLVGFSLGIPPLWLRFELAGTYHHLWGEVSDGGLQPALPFGEIDADGWSLAPSGALLGKF